MASDARMGERDVYRKHAVGGDFDSDADGSDLDVPTQYDRGFMEDEEQEEKLLLVESHSSRTDGPAEQGLEDAGRKERRRNLRKQRRSRKRKDKGTMGEDSKLMYEMEEGGSRDDASSQSSLSSLNLYRPEQQSIASTKV